jgi:hypothetical protein
MTEPVFAPALRWLQRPTYLACDFALHGPAWIPAQVRRLPLWCVARLLDVQVWWMTR